MVQGVYYYFYHIFRNKAQAAALEQKRKGIGDGSVASWDTILASYCYFIWVSYFIYKGTMIPISCLFSSLKV